MVQIIGTKKSNATKKAIRYFSERNIAYQFVDLSERGLSSGELRNISQAVGNAEQLLDTDSKTYRKRGMQYMTFDVLEELEEHPDLLVKPVVRFRSTAVLGEDADGWERVAKAADE